MAITSTVSPIADLPTYTTVATGAKLADIKLSKVIWVEHQIESFFEMNGFIGKEGDTSKPIWTKTELASAQGETIRIFLNKRITGSGQTDCLTLSRGEPDPVIAVVNKYNEIVKGSQQTPPRPHTTPPTPAQTPPGPAGLGPGAQSEGSDPPQQRRFVEISDEEIRDMSQDERDRIVGGE